mmetsp:Transcript_17959/g.30554  ORF Transcript_17959/g.30554 Transcript_17959/m.30554 type:complete len:94 (+) Transcript_17959:187-468(+)
MQRLHEMGESKRNMRIDMRPRVVVRVMRTELLWFFAGLTMSLSMPLYFLKFRPIIQKTRSEMQARKELEEQKELMQRLEKMSYSEIRRYKNSL